MEDHSRTRRQLTRVALALAIHRAENGAYPESLDALAPDLLPAPPVDRYHQNPLAYRRTDDGFLLYSFGSNGIDDGGSLDNGGGSGVFEGRDVGAEYDWTTEQVTGQDKAADDLLEQIPEGADDPSLRVPLPVEPWPWEDL